jgi:hypothetical protein
MEVSSKISKESLRCQAVCNKKMHEAVRVKLKLQLRSPQVTDVRNMECLTKEVSGSDPRTSSREWLCRLKLERA